MSTIVNKLAPQAVVLAAVLYWCWPALTGPNPGETDAPPIANVVVKKTAKNGQPSSKELTAAMLSPVLPSPATRNPLRPFDAQAAATAKKDGQSDADAGEKAVVDVRDAGLVLGATFVSGNRRFALINGRVYKENELVSQPDGGEVNFLVTHIQPERVLLVSQGQSMQLNYLDTAAKSAADASSKSADTAELADIMKPAGSKPVTSKPVSKPAGTSKSAAAARSKNTP